MSISKITKDLQGLNQKFPPVEKWSPDLCEGQEFYINREGQWFYNNSEIKNNIGLRRQSKLTKEQAKFVARCNSVHRDVSLNF